MCQGHRCRGTQDVLFEKSWFLCAQDVLEVVVRNVEPRAAFPVCEQTLARDKRWSIDVDRHDLISRRIGEVPYCLSLAAPEIAGTIDDALPRAQKVSYGAIGLVVDALSIGPYQRLIADVWAVEGELRIVEIHLLVAKPSGDSGAKR
jgi:hypothetical protein